MPMEDGFFAKFNLWKVWFEGRKEKKQWKLKERLLAHWRSEGKSDAQIVDLLREEGLLTVENRSLIGREEFSDLRHKRKAVLSQHEPFQKLLREKGEIYSKFKDLDWFTPREVGIMKEYAQIGLVRIDDRGAVILDYKNDPLIVNENGVPKGIPHKRDKYSQMSQSELHQIYEGNHPISVPEKGNFLRMKPEFEARKHRETAKRFVEWKRDLDARAQRQILKMKNGWNESETDSNSATQTPKGYAMSAHAIEDKYEKEGLVVCKFNINRERKKKGIKYWKRYMGNTFRPRRSSTKRWNHMWDHRMVLDRKVARRGPIKSHHIKGT